MKTNYIKTCLSALANLLNPLGLTFILGSFYFQYTSNKCISDIEDLRREILNIRLDNIKSRIEYNRVSEISAANYDSTLMYVKARQTPVYSPDEDLNRIDQKMDEVSKKLQSPNTIYLVFYVLGSICIVIDAFYKAFKE